jgi:hypothetical protein
MAEAMKKLMVLALLLAGCATATVDVKGAEEGAFLKYRNQHVSKLSVIWGPPDQAIYTFVGQSNTMVVTSLQTGTTAPTTISCRVSVYTDWSSNVIGLNHSGVPQACAEMYSRAR